MIPAVGVPAVASTDADIARTWRLSRPFVVAGAVSTIAGGLVAAVTRPLDLGLGSWAAAFLVLVGGVAQIGLGAGQAWLATPPTTARVRSWQLATWNGAVALTIAGAVTGTPLVTTVAGVVLAVALVLHLVATSSTDPARRLWATAYRSLLTIVVVSIPIGLALAWIRHG